MEQLTVKEALEQGYTHATYNTDDFTYCRKIDRIKEGDFDLAQEMFGSYILATKEASHYSFNDNTIKEVLNNHIYNQDEFNDEDGELAAIALEGCEDLLKQLTDKINENLTKKNFYFQTNIKLIP